jgi:NAD+ synthase
MSIRPELSDLLGMEESTVVDVIVRALRREVGRVGFEKVTLGLSGGLDSALVAHLTVEAFGAENVILVCMPYTTSNPDSLAHGLLVADRLGVRAREIPIGPQVDLYYADRADASLARRGNKMARERMSILYDISLHEDALVVGTSNKTELLLGYSTVFGDSACAVMPIGDLYKTQVQRLSEYMGVPSEVLEKAPSADLWEGQTDEQELGFSYASVDALLVQMVDRRLRPDALVELGFERSFIETVGRRIQRQQFKRKMPVIIKLSARTIDKDFLYPRDWTG